MRGDPRYTRNVHFGGCFFKRPLFFCNQRFSNPGNGQLSVMDKDCTCAKSPNSPLLEAKSVEMFLTPKGGCGNQQKEGRSQDRPSPLFGTLDCSVSAKNECLLSLGPAPCPHQGKKTCFLPPGEEEHSPSALPNPSSRFCTCAKTAFFLLLQGKSENSALTLHSPFL